MIKSHILSCFSDTDFLKNFAAKIADSFTANLNTKLKQFEERVDTLETQLVEAKVNSEMQLGVLKRENSELREMIEQLQQVNKSNKLRVYGLQERDNENVKQVLCEMFSKKLSVDVPSEAMGNCYRVGKNSKGNRQPRPVSVEFFNFYYRAQVFNKKKLLKGTKIIIAEDLVKARYNLYLKARERLGKQSVWTRDCRVYSKINNKIMVLQNLEDLEKTSLS